MIDQSAYHVVMSEPVPTSARALRNRFRDAESDAGCLRLLEAAAFAEESSVNSALAAPLAQAQEGAP